MARHTVILKTHSYIHTKTESWSFLKKTQSFGQFTKSHLKNDERKKKRRELLLNFLYTLNRYILWKYNERCKRWSIFCLFIWARAQELEGFFTWKCERKKKSIKKFSKARSKLRSFLWPFLVHKLTPAAHSIDSTKIFRKNR